MTCFTVLFVLYATVHLWPRWRSYTDVHNMNTIFITYFVSVTFVKCCIQMKGSMQYCLDGFFWACRSWPSLGTTIPIWECETCCSPVWIRYTNPQVSNWRKPHMCQCGCETWCSRLMKAIGKNFLLCFFSLSYFSLTEFFKHCSF